MMLRFFTPPILESMKPHMLLAFRYTKEPQWLGVFSEGLPPNFFEHEVRYAERPEDADAIILPHNFTALNETSRLYIENWCNEAERLDVPLYLFAFGDFTDELKFDRRAWVFRLSAYRSTMGPRDIIVPTTAEVFKSNEISIRPKQGSLLVSFCGFASFKSWRQWAGYFAKNMLWNARSVFNPVLRARKQGIYWRRKAMRALAHSPLIRTNFITRRSFSGALRTIELPPLQARAEFLDSIRGADFVLTPKGDGNYSNRFFETLSLERIPVVIDTDLVLPFEDGIDYSKITVRVPMKSVHKAPFSIREFYDSLSNEEWAERQWLAHKTFEEYLRQDAFFRVFFSRRLGL